MKRDPVRQEPSPGDFKEQGSSNDRLLDPGTASKRSVEAPVAQHPSEQLVLGRRSTHMPFGFGKSDERAADDDLVTYGGDAHLCTVAPSRSGKGTGVIIPNLLTYSGPVIVFDPKGENYMVTARRRREMGQQVIKLDPFGVVDDETASLNPLDLFHLSSTDVDCESQALADLLSRGIRGFKEPFWDINGSAFSSGLIAMAATQGEPEKRNLAHVVERLFADDVVYSLAVVLDTIGKQISPLAHREIATVLQMPDITRGGVIATTQTYYKPFLSDRIRKTLETTSFSLQDVVDGKPMSIYLVLPPNRLHSHRGLLKLWIGSLLTAIFTRRHNPRQRTLFLLDEAAQLETFPLLESLLTLSAGYGVLVHTFWQDLSQLKSCYPTSWKTILNNCAVIQTFGIYNRDMATQWADYLDHGSHQLRALAPDEQILSIHGQGEHRCRRLNYLTDARFQGMFDPNRFHQKPPESSGPTLSPPHFPLGGPTPPSEEGRGLGQS